MSTRTKKGFTLFFATLIGSLALAVGVSIFELTVRELDLSQTATQSQFAIFAADAGVECALYWDFKCLAADDPFCGFSGGSAFATSTAGAGASANTSLPCNSLDITDPDSADAQYNNSVRTASAATTTFTLRFTGQGKPYCANVTVSKSGNPSQTIVISRGYNTCVAAPLQLERSFRVTY